MATIVRNSENGRSYILIGVGFGMFKSTRPGKFLGDLIPKEESGEARLVAATDASGRIKWFHAKDLEVISIDGVAPGDLLK